MAQKVTIDIPGIGKVDADNAASEYTLNEILKILQGYKGAGGGGGGSGGGAAAAGKAAKASAAQANASNAAASAADTTADSFAKLTKASFNAMKGLANAGSSVTSAAGVVSDALGALPGVFGQVGKVVGAVFEAVADAVEKSTKAYQDAASVGASFSGSVGEFGANAAAAGMDLATFGNFVKSNATSMALLGGTTEEGAKRFTVLSKSLRTGADGLYALGYSTEELNNGIAAYTKLNSIMGNNQKMSNAQLVEGSKKYMEELDLLAKVTGESRKSQQDAMDALGHDAAFNAATMNASTDAQKTYMDTILAAPKPMQDFMKEVLTSGVATGKNAQLASLMSETYAESQRLQQKVAAGQKITLEEQNHLSNTYARESKKVGAMYGGANIAAAINQGGELGEAFKSISEASRIQENRIIDASKAQQEAKEKTDAQNAAYEKLRQKVAAASDYFTNMFSNMKVFDALTKAFDGLVLVGKILAPILSVLFDVIGTVVGALFDVLNPALEILADIVTNVVMPPIKWLADQVMIVAKLIAEDLGWAIGLVRDGLKWLGDLLKPVGSIFKEMGDWVQDHVTPILRFFVSPLTRVVGVFHELYKAGYTVQTFFGTLGNKLADLSDVMGEFLDEMLVLLNKVTFGAAGITREQANKNAADRKINAEARAADQASIDQTVSANAAIAAAAAQTTQTTAASRTAQEAFQSTTTAIDKKAAQTTMGTGAVAGGVTGFGKVAAQYESGNDAGKISSGKGDAGGKSYGLFQLASKTGTLDKFLKESGYGDQFKGMQTGGADFDKKWKDLAANDKGFADAQRGFAKQTHYDPQMAMLKKNGIDLSGKGAGVQEAVMSTSNQYGAGSKTILNALQGKDTSKMDDKQIINAIQDYKKANVATNFKSSSADVQAGVAKRIESERAALLGVKPDAANPQVASAGAGRGSVIEKPGERAAAQAVAPNTAQAAAPTVPETPKVDETGRAQLEADAAAKAKTEAEAKTKAEADAKAASTTASGGGGILDQLSNMFAPMHDNLGKIANNSGEQIDATRQNGGDGYTYGAYAMGA